MNCTQCGKEIGTVYEPAYRLQVGLAFPQSNMLHLYSNKTQSFVERQGGLLYCGECIEDGVKISMLVEKQ